jgi:hypothetical protein
MSDYNGWSNRETWLVNVWFNPGSASDLDAIKDMIETDYDNLPDYMRDFCSIEAIDWQELAAHFEEEGDNHE